MAAILEQQKNLYLDEHGTPMNAVQEKQNFDIMVSLQGLYFCDAESISHFGSDAKYWETISDGLHCTSDVEDFSKRLEALRQKDASLKTAGGEKLTETGRLIENQGFAVVDNSNMTEARKLVLRRIWNTVKNLEQEGWPAAFIFLFDEFWMFHVEPMFDIYGALLDDNDCLMEPDLNCWSLRPTPMATGRYVGEESSNYIGRNFGKSHRDMKYNMCHDADTEKFNSLNAWVPMNPSGASHLNGAMRVIPIEYDDFHYDSNHLYHMNTKKALGFMEKGVLEKEATKILEAGVGALCTWVPSLIHWGGACGNASMLEKGNTEPRMSFAATFRKSIAPRSQYGVDGSETEDLEKGPPPIGRKDLNFLDIGRRLSYVAKAIISFAHWYPGFPGLDINRLEKGCR
jgi:hypothetical protein